MLNLYFIRHGETDWNREGRLQGQRDIPLNTTGEQQAHDVAFHLKTLTQDGLARLPFYVSPLTRTRQTAQIIRTTLGLTEVNFTHVDCLREIHFGEWEGKIWPEIRAFAPSLAEARKRDKWGFSPPSGESYADVQARIAPFFAGISQDCCIVAHGGIARAMLVHLAGVSPKDAVLRDIWQGKVLCFSNGEAHWYPAR